MTPAEKPRVTDKNFVLVWDVKNAKMLPIPVARPANKVNPNANKRFSVTFDSLPLRNLLLNPNEIFIFGYIFICTNTEMFPERNK